MKKILAILHFSSGYLKSRISVLFNQESFISIAFGRGAIKSFDRAISLNPEIAGYFCFKGIVCHRLKLYKESLNNCSKAIELKPNYYEAYLTRGLVKMHWNEELKENRFSNYDLYQKDYNELDSFRGAMQDFDKAIELKPNYFETYLTRGLEKFHGQDFQGAIMDLTRAIELKPNLGLAYYWRGQAKSALNDFMPSSNDKDIKADYVKARKLGIEL